MVRVERIVNKIFESNTFVISNDGLKDVWLVDVGDTEKVLSILPLHSIVKGVFLTHTHFDDLYGINILYDSFPEMVVYVAVNGIDALYSEKKNLSKYHGSPLKYKGSKIKSLRDGDTIELYKGIQIRAIYTPGHTPDSMSFLIEDKYLFTGDAYIPDTPVVSKLPGGDKKTATISQQRLKEMAYGKILLPGHGDIENNYKL